MMRTTGPALLLAAILIGTLGAQQSSTVTSAYRVQVKPGMGAAAETALAAHARWRAANGDPWTWRVYQVATGDDLGDLIIRSSGHSWADFDAYEDFLQKAAIHFNAVMGPVMESISNTIERDIPQLSHWPEDTEANLVSVTQFTVHPSRMQQFQEAIATFHKTLQDADWKRPYSWGATVNGGRGRVLTAAVAFSSWSEMSPPDREMQEMMVQAHGEEKAAAIAQAFTDAIRNSRNFVVRYRPDLSVNVN